MFNGQRIFQCKRKVALVMRWHAHDGAVAVAHQHIVAHPERHLGAGQRVRDKEAGVHAGFFFHGQLCLRGAAGFAFFDEGRQRRVAGRSVHRQRMLRCHGAKGDAHDRVRPRGEHIHAPLADQGAAGIFNGVREGKAHAFALADPVFLHQLDALGPAGQAGLHMVEQLLRVVGDLQVIARNFALFHQRAGAPAAPVDHLLIGQHGLVHRVPVHDLRLAVGHANIEHLQKQPLVPLVVARVAGGYFAAPVDGQAHGLHLLLHVGDVFVGPLGRWHPILQRRVFCR